METKSKNWEYHQLSLAETESNANSKNLFYMEMIVNPTRYSVQINTYQFPYVNSAAVTAAGFTAPSNFNTNDGGAYPSSSSYYFNPKVNMSAGFNNIVGYSPTFSTDLNINGAYSVPANNSYISKDTSTQTISYLS